MTPQRMRDAAQLLGEFGNSKMANELITLSNLTDSGKLSDGYHTFDELYMHRSALYIALCRALDSKGNKVWRSNTHSDGSHFEGWFLLGIGEVRCEQITYHLPSNRWSECDFATTSDKAPEFDGHTSNDVLIRLRSL